MTEQTPKLDAAVAKVMLDVKRLKKADNNAFAKYRYTSVDDFKDALRPILADNDLSISLTENNSIFSTVKNSKGEETTILKFNFEATLHHANGESATPEGISVALPFVGAQTTGQARSYALKEYLKSRFLASSGDSEDADQHDTDLELSRAEARPIYKELQEQLGEAAKDGADAMKEWVSKRRPSIDILPKDWRLQLRARYQEFLATGKTTQIDEDEEDPGDVERDIKNGKPPQDSLDELLNQGEDA